MQIEVLPDADTAARSAAEYLAARARAAVEARGRFVLAASGGKAPWAMFRVLADQEVPWEHVEIVQVDERVAPDGHPDRNLTHLRECLLGHCPLKPSQIHAMPVNEPDLREAAAKYARTLEQLTGPSRVIDLVHLGLGPDGHTASLVPNDPVLDVTDVDVAPSGPYQGRQRLTLTYPILNRAREILWLITDGSKVEMLRRLRAGDRTIPAGRIRQDNARIYADEAAQGKSQK
jgi:6-phosphogluconolactonase